jgi:hypothetical protein
MVKTMVSCKLSLKPIHFPIFFLFTFLGHRGGGQGHAGHGEEPGGGGDETDHDRVPFPERMGWLGPVGGWDPWDGEKSGNILVKFGILGWVDDL